MSCPGPCVVCGATNYSLSLGGPGICPSCDCGIPPEVSQLRAENEALLARIRDLEAAYGYPRTVAELADQKRRRA